MAISIISQPRSPINPAYNPLVYVVDSNMKSTSGFRYIVEIFRGISQPVKIGDLKLEPRAGNGYGYVDLSGILKNFVDKALQFGSTDYDATLNTAFPYTVHFGEEYFFNSFYSGVVNLNGFMAFVCPNGHNIPTSAIGNNIRAENNIQVYPDSRQNVNGVWLIKSIPDNFTIETSIPWGIVTGNPISAQCPGFLFFADRRTERKNGLSKITGSVVVNAALTLDQYKDYIDSATSPWQANSAAGELLTNLPLSGFYATLDQHLYLHAYSKPNDQVQELWFENSNGSQFKRLYLSNIPEVKGFACGPGNYGALTLVSGSGNLIEATTEWYNVWVGNIAGTWVSQKHRINLDRRCAINPYQILFMDKKSSWGSYAFQLRRKEILQVEKSMYRKEIPKTITPGWTTLDRADQGTTIYHTRSIKKFELNTDWMLSDEMNVYFEELLSSPYCYVNWGDGKWYSVIVEALGEPETKRFKNEKVIRRSITCYAAIEDPVQTASTITPYIGKGYNLADGYQDAVAGDIIIDVRPGPGLG
jgi:hypothetical protein